MDDEVDGGLPIEVWYRILKCLDPTQLYVVRTVCMAWAHYIDSDAPWLEFTDRYFGKRYENARFLADPSLSTQDRFWRTTRLHQNWNKLPQSSVTLGGTIGHVSQIRLKANTLAINLGSRVKVFDMSTTHPVWQLHDELRAGYRIPSFDMWDKFVMLPGTSDHSLLNVIDYTTNKRQLQIRTGQSILVVRHALQGNYIASGGRKIQVWDPAQPQEAVLTLNEQHRGVVNCLELEERLVTACHKGKKIRVWDLRSGERVFTLSGHQHLIHCLALNDMHIASGSKDATLRLWDRRRTDQPTQLIGHDQPVRALSMDDWKIVSGSRDRTVRVWDIAKQEQLYKIQSTESIHSLAFHETALYVGGSSLVRHDYTPKRGGRLDHPFDCTIS